jgi:hypothetical protein
VDVRPALVARPESLDGVQPGEAALDDPPLAAQAGAVGDAAAGDPRSDPALAELSTVDVVVVAAVAGGAARAGPPIGGTASTSGMSWVVSLRLPPVRLTASGMPPESRIR